MLAAAVDDAELVDLLVSAGAEAGHLWASSQDSVRRAFSFCLFSDTGHSEQVNARRAAGQGCAVGRSQEPVIHRRETEGLQGWGVQMSLTGSVIIAGGVEGH